MSTITSPAKVLAGNITSISLYIEGGITNDIRYIVTLSNILPQVYLNANKTAYAQYNGLNIQVGDWISSGPYGRAYQVTAITSATTTTLTCEITDINGYILSTFGNNFPIGGKAYVFEINEEGFPILSSPLTVDAQDLVTKSWQVDLMSHFMSRNLKSQYVSIQQSGHGLSVGDPIYIDSSGVFHKSSGDSTNLSKTIGLVSQVNIPDSTWFSFRPLGNYYDNSYLDRNVVPSGYTGGNILYINPTGPGPTFVTTKPVQNAFPVWQMITSSKAVLFGGGGGGGGGGGIGATGPTGTAGATFTTLQAVNEAVVTSPISCLIPCVNGGGNYVYFLETLSPISQGFYGQLTVPSIEAPADKITATISNGAETYRIEFDPPPVYTESTWSIFNNGRYPIDPITDTYTGNNTLFSFYADTQNIYFYKSGASSPIAVFPLDLSNPYTFSIIGSSLLSRGETYEIKNIRFYPTGAIGTTGPQGIQGIGVTGPRGETFTTLTVYNGISTILTPTSFTIFNNSQVSTLEKLNPTYQGLYLQTTVPAISGGNRIWIGIDSYIAAGYKFELNGTTWKAIQWSTTIATGTYSGGETFSIYTDSQTVYFYIDGSYKGQTPLDTGYSYGYVCRHFNIGSDATYLFTNVRLYPTGKIAPAFAPTTLTNAYRVTILSTSGSNITISSSDMLNMITTNQQIYVYFNSPLSFTNITNGGLYYIFGTPNRSLNQIQITDTSNGSTPITPA